MEDDETFDDLPIGSGTSRQFRSNSVDLVVLWSFACVPRAYRGSCPALVPAAVRVILKKTPGAAGGDGVAPVAAAASSTGAAGGSGST